MMNLRRRTARTAIAVAAVAAALLTTSCSSAGSGGDEKITLRFAWWGSEQLDAIKAEQIASFEKAHPNITVTGEPSEYNGYYDKLATQVAGGNGPDVLQITYNYIAEYAGRNALLDLSTVEKQLDLSDYAEGSLDGGMYEGKNYGVPTGLGARGIIVNPAIFEAAGVPLPDDSTWTWDDYVDIAAKITAASPAGTFGSTQNNTEQGLNTIARQNGRNIYSEDGGVGKGIEQDAEFMFDLSKRLIETGGSPDASATAEQDGLALEQRLMGTGKVAMSFEPINFIDIYAQSSGQELKILNVPNDGGKPGLWPQPTVLYSASAKSAHPKESAMLIDWLLNSKEAAPLNKLTLGIPANPDVLAAIEPDLTPNEVVQKDFLDKILAEGGAPNVQTPVGGTETQTIIAKLGSDVMFGSTTPKEAAKAFVDQLKAALK
ncbi:sugar ABC transporter substrate-binding protein [Plantibacter sp. ME-Dv--P-122b]|uniref:ABC transporter substrate-binding protein n=1 Tax=Plantibacter sp. ME-Dv--P-122b TaxID=3040300 RepID=UPI00254C974C|nr:sugar ABC transporter substrate-binding protein [Plantibacter sp. ME-Dv--P-122b]